MRDMLHNEILEGDLVIYTKGSERIIGIANGETPAGKVRIIDEMGRKRTCMSNYIFLVNEIDITQLIANKRAFLHQMIQHVVDNPNMYRDPNQINPNAESPYLIQRRRRLELFEEGIENILEAHREFINELNHEL